MFSISEAYLLRNTSLNTHRSFSVSVHRVGHVKLPHHSLESPPPPVVSLSSHPCHPVSHPLARERLNIQLHFLCRVYVAINPLLNWSRNCSPIAHAVLVGSRMISQLDYSKLVNTNIMY